MAVEQVDARLMCTTRDTFRQKSGFATVETTFLFVFLVIVVWFALSLQAILYRAGIVSHFSFRAGRRAVVMERSTTTIVRDFVERDYEALRVRGAPLVSTRMRGTNPRHFTVAITDQYRLNLPTARAGAGILPGIEMNRFVVPVGPVSTVGTAPRARHTDNEL